MAVVVLVADRHFVLEGDAGKAAVPELVESGWASLSREAASQKATATKKLTMDLSLVTGADSATLALLLEWLGRARRASITLSFLGFPEELMALAKVGGVDGLLFEAI